MQASDESRVSEIRVFAWRSSYRHIFSDEHLFSTLLVSKQSGHFENVFSYESYVYDDGIIKGFLATGPCEDDDELDSFEVGSLYIDPFMHRQGIGTAMMAFCENAATQRGYSKICLWTLEKNAAARSFYEKQGYAPDGARKFLNDIGTHQVRYSKEI